MLLAKQWAQNFTTEKYCKIFNADFNTNIMNLRYSIVYGEREWFGRVLTIFLKRAQQGKAPVILAPLIWLPVTTTSSTSSAEKIASGLNSKLNRASLSIIFISPPKIMIYKKNLRIFYLIV